MKRHIPGLHGEGHNAEDMLEGVFLVRVDRVFYRWHPQRPFYVLRLAILEPQKSRPFTHRASLLHSQGALETPMVPAGLWLRPRSDGPRRGR